MQVGYPEFFYSQSGESPPWNVESSDYRGMRGSWLTLTRLQEYFLNGAKALGIPRVGDLNTGNTTGAAIIPSSMTLKKQSRASARSSCLDPVVFRQNLHVAIEQRVTRILLDGTAQPRATGVEVRCNANNKKAEKPIGMLNTMAVR